MSLLSKYHRSSALSSLSAVIWRTDESKRVLFDWTINVLTNERNIQDNGRFSADSFSPNVNACQYNDEIKFKFVRLTTDI